jgi:mannose-6-phosphate isomerase-like protein (cupin superfamily)
VIRPPGVLPVHARHRGGPDDRRRHPRPIPADALRIGTGRTLRFEGSAHGSGVSFFLVDSAPGGGPDLHRHPYTETFTILDGCARLTVGDRTVVAAAGTTVVVPPHTWHRFVNPGPGRLNLVGIHASDVIEQEFRDEQG